MFTGPTSSPSSSARNPRTSSLDVAEAPGLVAVAVDRERFAAQRLHDEVRHHPPVVGLHPRPVGVEDPHDAHVEATRAVVRHRDRFSESFGLVVDAANTDRVDVAPVRLGLGVHERVAVHLARRGLEEPGIVARRQLEEFTGAAAADVEDLEGYGLEVLRRCRAGEVHHRIERAVDDERQDHVVVDQREPWVVGEVLDVLLAAGHEVVDAHHLLATLDQRVAQVRSEEPGAAGDEDAHQRRPTPSYSNPASRTRAGSRRFLVSTMVTPGRATAANPARSILANSGHSVKTAITSASAADGEHVGDEFDALEGAGLMGRQRAGHGRIERADPRPVASELADDRQGRRLAQVVGARLEREAEGTHRDPGKVAGALPGGTAADGERDLVDHPLELFVVDVDDAPHHREVVAVLLGDLHEGPRILREAAAAPARTRVAGTAARYARRIRCRRRPRRRRHRRLRTSPRPR